ncbi:MAG: PilZ domain-containing protein [Bdellovibrionales bacterium]|nr:PilZ domain-containing protein [Bdellovibrionales bacterium]
MKLLKRLLIRWIPQPFRGVVMRRWLHLPLTDPADIRFSVATNSELRWQAYELVYNCYLETGSETTQEHPFRTNPYLALPTTQTIVAIKNNKVVGTLSLILESSLGLPAFEKIPPSDMASNGEVIAEFSSLAIAKKERGNQGQIFWGMIRYIWEIHQRSLNIDTIVAMVRPHRAEMFISFLGFQKLSNDPIKNYRFSNNATVYCLTLQLKEFPFWIYSHYSRHRVSGDLFAYLFTRKTNSLDYLNNEYLFQYAERFSENEISQLRSLWKDKLDSLNPSQLAHIASHYPSLSQDNDSSYVRREARIDFLHEAICYENSKIHRIRILNFAKSGLSIQSDAALKMGQSLHLKIRVSEFDSARLTAKIVRKDLKRQSYGLIVLDADQIWNDYINHIFGDKRSA